jgi:ABC-type Mn2+/Zn2+ transport system permease subunit
VSLEKQGNELGLLRAAALLAVVAGAVGAVGLTLYAGRHNSSLILKALFVLWVLSPFAALVGTDVISKRWPFSARAALYVVMLVIAIGTLAIYGAVALGPPRAKTAPVFVVVPPASWLLIAVVVPIAICLGKRRR